MLSSDIKNFYSRLKFPGEYTQQQLNSYATRPDNRYLGFIHDYLGHNQTVLDAGCGSGLITNLFAGRFNSKFTAVDFADSIKFGENFAKNHNIDNTQWIQQDLVGFDPNTRFDVVICQGVLHHVPNYHDLLNKLKSWTKPKGILLLGLYNPWGKIQKKIRSISYPSSILRCDQESNPFEISFTVQQTLDLCSDLEFLSATPWHYNKYFTDFSSFFNSTNGGLILYAFRRTHD